ncbi:MAG: metalloregulator ArsR/SmtB family transcription factor [Syntrophorhabdaceae bacterium]|nr:metalloregulator ArsR/SmtB family transcription factor [Syntrophorhabdaceae bacterium]MDD5242565.1 metalloregulator ArsR/SmtB family transcription factor [Syntrophorhabdaceae bacterium]
MNDLAATFKALSDETRLRIIKLLERGELCVCDLVAALDMVQPKVSFHLGVLKKAGILKDRRAGKWMHYRLDDADMFKRLLMLSVFERMPEGASNRDKKRLEAALQNRCADRQSGMSVCCAPPDKQKAAK